MLVEKRHWYIYRCGYVTKESIHIAEVITFVPDMTGTTMFCLHAWEINTH